MAGSPLAVGMTLDAQFLGQFIVQHGWLVAGSTPIMTAHTVKSKIFVSRVNYLFADGMGRMGLPFMAFSAKFGIDRRADEEQNIISGMRRVTADAIAGFHGHTQILIFGIIFRPFLQF